jgi:hypothetical protein
MKQRSNLICVLALVSLLGCEKKEAPAQPASEAPASPPAAAVSVAPPPVAEPTVDAATLAVEEQFEAEAEGEITADNLTAKLDEIEKEIGSP